MNEKSIWTRASDGKWIWTPSKDETRAIEVMEAPKHSDRWAKFQETIILPTGTHIVKAKTPQELKERVGALLRAYRER